MNSFDNNDLALINQLAKSQLSDDQIYTFSVRLCDNEVDRDFERFRGEDLDDLGNLMLGKAGIFDHQWSAENQTARIYRTEVVRESAVLTAAGDPYCWLKGWAYMLRSEKNADLIREIEAGIKKEVSVGCSMARSVCSICGDVSGCCEHVKGQSYQGRLCFRELPESLNASVNAGIPICRSRPSWEGPSLMSFAGIPCASLCWLTTAWTRQLSNSPSDSSTGTL